MNVQIRVLPLILVLGVLVGCEDSRRSLLTPTSPSFSTTGDAIATKTGAMQTKVDQFHASGDIDNEGIAKGLKKLLSNAGEAAMRDDLKATENMMRAFQNRVRAQRGKHIKEVAADELDTDAQEVVDLSTGEVAPTEADLSVTLTAMPNPVTAGEELLHTITLSNPGPANVADPEVSLLIVGQVHPVSAPAACTSTIAADGLSFDCTIAALDAGTDATLSIVVAPQTGGEPLISQADITHWVGADDPDETNNIAAVATYVNSRPTAEITQPLNASLFVQGEQVTFSGSATDPEDGAVTGTSLVWASSIDGQIGTGGSFARNDLSTGTHTITLTATDSHGASGSASLTMDVVALGTSQGSSLQWTKVLGAVTDHAITLYDAWGTSSSDVWAVGSGDGSRTAILRYDGANWIQQPTGTTAGFLGVWGSSSNDVFFVGSHGMIRHYDGVNWSFHDTPHTKNLRDVWGASGTDVWAVGAYTLLHYDGSMWTEELTDYRLTSVWGSSSSDVWAVGPGVVLRYDGQTWEPQSHTFPDNNQTLTSGGAPLAVWGSGSEVFIAGQYGKLLHYDAATDTWTQHKTPSEISTEAFYSLWGTSPGDVYAVGSFGTVLHFDGASWSRIRAGGPILWGIWGSASGDIFTVGGGATILHYRGSDWNVHSAGTTLRAIWGASQSDVFAVGGGLILHYDGASWSAQNTGLTGNRLAAAAFRGVSGTSGSDVWVVGDGGAILHYDGVRWTERASGTRASLVSAWANSSDDVFAVGSSSTILHYDGASWTPQTSPVTTAFQEVSGASGDAVWAVGSDGKIVYYDGTSWSTQTSGTDAMLYGVWAAASNRAFATGNVLGVLHYDGTSWTEHSTGTYWGREVWGASLTDVFTSLSTTGAVGKILHYDGSTWSVQDTGVGSVLFHGIWGSSATNVYAVGWYGTIVRGTP